eukprot:scaffold642_cov166-Ochromonas_danica.AAC.20
MLPEEKNSDFTREVNEYSESDDLEENDDLEWEEWNPKKLSFWHHMVAGSAAGLAEHVSIFPIDTIKTNVQCEKCGSSNIFKTWKCVARMVSIEGPFRLWRGVSAMFAGCIPASKRALGVTARGEHQPFRAAVCGVIAAISHDLIMTPFDVVKQRMQLGYYASVRHCIKSIVRTEGVRALYISFPMTLSMNIPYGAIMVPVNESMKKVLNPSGRFDYRISMISGAVAGAVAAAVTTPLDIIKTRLQTQNLQPVSGSAECQFYAKQPQAVVSSSLYSDVRMPGVRSFMTVAPTRGRRGRSRAAAFLKHPEGVRAIVHRLIAEDGAVGFFRGVVPRVLTQAPSVAISWTVYETVKDFLQA